MLLTYLLTLPYVSLKFQHIWFDSFYVRVSTISDADGQSQSSVHIDERSQLHTHSSRSSIGLYITNPSTIRCRCTLNSTSVSSLMSDHHGRPPVKMTWPRNTLCSIFIAATRCCTTWQPSPLNIAGYASFVYLLQIASNLLVQAYYEQYNLTTMKIVWEIVHFLWSTVAALIIFWGARHGIGPSK